MCLRNQPKVSRSIPLTSLFIHPLHLTDVPQPSLTLSSTVIKERDTVQLSCQTPPSISEAQSYFYLKGREEYTLTLTCQQTLTGTLLLTMSYTGVSDTDSVKLSCQTPPSLDVSHCYIYKQGLILYADTHRNRAALLGRSSISSCDKSGVFLGFRDHKTKPQIQIQLSKHKTKNPDTTCNLYVGEESQPSFTEKIWKEKTKASNQWFCTFIVTESDLVSRLQSVRRKEVSCDYRVSSGPNSLSPRSDGKSFEAVQLWQAAVGMASGVGVFLMGLTAVCLCRRTNDLVMAAVSSAGMLESGDAGIYSLITSVPSTFLPSGPVDENGKYSANHNPDAYHVYSSIPDRPATSAQPDGLYSLLQAH
ncbi:unnamed protein product [Coregonus sp. 'balchen']|nr:unnamed protein product [Coregonus sp. 'balchen']